MLSGSPCGVSSNAAALGFSLGALYPSALCSIGVPASLFQISFVVLFARLGQISSRIPVVDPNFLLLVFSIINVIVTSVARLLARRIRQTTTDEAISEA